MPLERAIPASGTYITIDRADEVVDVVVAAVDAALELTDIDLLPTPVDTCLVVLAEVH